MPYGAKFLGILRSSKASLPKSVNLKLESNTSILRFWPSSAAYRNGCPWLVAMARPVYVAPASDLSAAILAMLAPVGLTPPTAGFHPQIVPSCVAKMKIELAEDFLPVIGLTPEIVKAVTPVGVSGATIPGGVPCPPVTDGTVTTRPSVVAATTPFVLLME